MNQKPVMSESPNHGSAINCAGVMQDLNPQTRESVFSSGGWMAFGWDLTPELHYSIGYAIDDPDNSRLCEGMKSLNHFGFTNISRDHGLVYTAPLPDVGEWNRFGASVELNGEKIAPPKWKRPGLKKGKPIADWTPAWTLYEADEEPFTDQEYVMREPTQIHLRKGWNHVKLTLPNPQAKEKTRHRWVGTFIPVAGTTDHPHEVEGLIYASEPPAS